MILSARPKLTASSARKKLALAVLARTSSMVLPECSAMTLAMICLVSIRSSLTAFSFRALPRTRPL